MEQIQQFATAGVNIQFPWSELIVSGKKVVETRGYPLPKKFLGRTLAIIETSKKSRSSSRASTKIIGLIQFSSSFKYGSFKEWRSDFKRHRVRPDDVNFSYKTGVPKWGWEISRVCRISPPIDPPKIRGIKYAKKCLIPKESVRASPSNKSVFLSNCTFQTRP